MTTPLRQSSGSTLARTSTANTAGFTDTPAAALQAILQVLAVHREELALLLSRDNDVIIPPGERLTERINGELYFLKHYLAGDKEYGDFLLGDKARVLRAVAGSGDPSRNEALLRQEQNAILRAFGNFLAPAHLSILATILRDYYAPLLQPAPVPLNLLFVGDCLGREIQCFLYSLCRKLRVDLNFIHIGGKTDLLIIQALHDVKDVQPDLIFYSPFTYESIPGYSGMSRSFLLSPNTISSKAREAARQAIAVTELLRQRYPIVPIFMHNSSFILRETQPEQGLPLTAALKQIIKRTLSRRVRHQARRAANEFLSLYFSAQPAPRQLHLFDEANLVDTFGEHNLRQLMYTAEDIHPTRLGFHLARDYHAIIAGHLLRSKKVVVTDLDNTLWQGLIGEGDVQQYHDRQRILKRLRQHGFLLAICSKNDPGNIRWPDMVLRQDDFVAAQINWESKAANIKSIASQINLKLKDFIFVDDMATERALVQQEIPEITVCDAAADDTWIALDYLARLSPKADEEMDRTALYRAKIHRDNYLQAASEDIERHEHALKSLELVAHIDYVSTKDAARVCELVNRTNQFNTSGHRTTEALIRARVDDRQHPVLCVHVRDRFGECGLVAATLLEFHAAEIDVAAFVLSCRVFGFGIETALLNVVKKLAQARGTRSVVGKLVETSQNQPCRNLFSDHGFQFREGRWCCECLENISDPAWLSIVVSDAISSEISPEHIRA